MTTIDFNKLLEPFPANEIEWRAGATNQDKTKALAMAYLTSRAVMNRLDAVVGPANWQDAYEPAPSGGVMCGISILVDGNWITKHDVGENTDFEAIKGGFSDAFKRAAVKWGIGRYLYNLDGVWVPCEQHGKTVVLKTTPSLPSWALPGGHTPQKTTYTAPAEKPAVQDEQPEEPYHTHEAIESGGQFSGICTDEGVPYSELKMADLAVRFNSLSKSKAKDPTGFSVDNQRKLDAVNHYMKILKSRGNA